MSEPDGKGTQGHSAAQPPTLGNRLWVWTIFAVIWAFLAWAFSLVLLPRVLEEVAPYISEAHFQQGGIISLGLQTGEKYSVHKLSASQFAVRTGITLEKDTKIHIRARGIVNTGFFPDFKEYFPESFQLSAQKPCETPSRILQRTVRRMAAESFFRHRIVFGYRDANGQLFLPSGVDINTPPRSHQRALERLPYCGRINSCQKDSQSAGCFGALIAFALPKQLNDRDSIKHLTSFVKQELSEERWCSKHEQRGSNEQGRSKLEHQNIEGYGPVFIGTEAELEWGWIPNTAPNGQCEGEKEAFRIRPVAHSGGRTECLSRGAEGHELILAVNDSFILKKGDIYTAFGGENKCPSITPESDRDVYLRQLECTYTIKAYEDMEEPYQPLLWYTDNMESFVVTIVEVRR